MKTFEYTITDPLGVHLRPVGLLAKEAQKYTSAISITKGGKKVNCTRLMTLMGMGIKQGDTIIVSVEGADEDTAAPIIEEFFKAKL